MRWWTCWRRWWAAPTPLWLPRSMPSLPSWSFPPDSLLLCRKLPAPKPALLFFLICWSCQYSLSWILSVCSCYICFCCFSSSSSSSSVPRRLNLSINLKGVTFLIPWVIISVFQMAVVRCVIRRLVCQRPRFTGWNSRHRPVCCDDRRLWYQMWLFCAPSAQEWDHVIARDDIAHCDRSQWWPCMFWLINPVAVLLPGM